MRKSIQCWQCGTRMTLDALASNDGDCPECEVEIHLGDYLSEALDTNQRLEAELAELKAKAAVPDGWKLVPKKPTPEMRTAAIGVEIYADSPAIADCLTWAEAEAIYKAMLAAAQSKDGV